MYRGYGNFRTKDRDLAQYRPCPEEIAANWGYMSLAQISAALAYYYANKAEIDAELEAERRLHDELAAQHRRDPQCA